MLVSTTATLLLLTWCLAHADPAPGIAVLGPQDVVVKIPTSDVVEPCKMLHDLLAATTSDSSLGPDTVKSTIPAELAHQCAMSAPLVKEEALRLLDIVLVLLEWQSTLAYLRNPPPGYLLPPVDIMAEIGALRRAVDKGDFESEYAYQEKLTNILGSAHDGHLHIALDAMRVFGYVRSLGDIVSVSLDGQGSPLLYTFHDIQHQQLVDGEFVPSPITMIDGQDAESWVRFQALKKTDSHQDPDAMYNAFTKTPSSDGKFLICNGYPGPATNVTFKNGSVGTWPNEAVLLQPFAGVIDGKTFYDKFVSGLGAQLEKPTRAKLQRSQVVPGIAKSGVATSKDVRLYPRPINSTSDHAISGYFLDTRGFDKVAVLNLRSFLPADIHAFHSTLINFLQTCVETGKEYLVIDVQGNGGGNIGLGYDVFTQLFPGIQAYATANYRAHEQLAVMGDFFSREAHAVLRATGNIQNYTAAGGFSLFDALASNDATGQKFRSWDAFNGPVSSHGDRFTNLVRLDVQNADFDLFLSGIVFSGPAEQPFRRENIIVLADGDCASTCDTFMHLMKWQAEVKTVVAGGRPQPGPMQFVGGVKGRRKLGIGYLNSMLKLFHRLAPEDVQAAANRTKLKYVLENIDYLAYRTRDWFSDSSSSFSVNLGNAIARDDASLTPLQFVYEAADCRVWWRPDHFFDLSTLWLLVAGTAFGLNDTEKWAACVQNSTNHPSSVGGGGHVVFNVTASDKQQASSTDVQAANINGEDDAAPSNGGGLPEDEVSGAVLRTELCGRGRLALFAVGFAILISFQAL